MHQLLLRYQGIVLSGLTAGEVAVNSLVPPEVTGFSVLRIFLEDARKGEGNHMSDKIADLVARLTRLEDLEAIRHTWRDYCIRLDSSDWSALGDVFTEDAVLEMD